MSRARYDKYPRVVISDNAADCRLGWKSVLALIEEHATGRKSICVECYPGVFEKEITGALLDCFSSAEIFLTHDCLKPAADIDRMLAEQLSDDPVFGRISSLELIDFFDEAALALMRERIVNIGRCLVVGTGAVFAVDEPDLLVYADLARWEIQQRQRRGEIGNFGSPNKGAKPAEKYKRAFFVDWRVADRLKKTHTPEN